MSNNILFIFEGESTEKIVVDSLTKFFVNNNTIITCAYCTTIYSIYTRIKGDEYLDTFNLVKDIEVNKDILQNFKRSDFSQIYMFFDYDGHATNASDEKLIELLNFFNEETEKGKLYISYPMVEALKHIKCFNTFEDLKVKHENFRNYKQLVSSECIDKLKHFHCYDKDIWKKTIKSHLKKMNKVVNNVYDFPKNIIDQITIFNKQLEKHIKKDRTVAVLSAFPIFLHDYYGNEQLKNLIHSQNTKEI
ncbi:hypothetical protein [Riemerella anatipestifer]|uniref:hypothetical protein n=1 Tax=Riemerella anatipestifer TaxID=34085 RepID=UPI0006995097|nr:hypothetical protein [Riemerella anatipestifer]